MSDAKSIAKVLTAVVSHMAAITTGIEASTAVAINCIGGLSFGQLLVYIASFELQCRYDGMKKAFGEDMEIFKVIGSDPHPQQLLKSDYDRMVTVAYTAYLASQAATSTSTSHFVPGGPISTSETSFSSIPNYYLRAHSNFPIIRWGRGVHHPLVTVLYTAIALGSFLSIFVVKLYLRSSCLFEILYLVTFLVVSIYTNVLLRIHRSVVYIEIHQNELSDDIRPYWETLKSNAKRLPLNPEEAVENTRKCFVSKFDENETENGPLLLPVMAISTVLEDEVASWLLLLNDFRGPLMTTGLWFSSDDGSIKWGVMYGLAAYLQARLQRAVAERYLKDAKTSNVFWFRRYSSHQQEYPIVPQDHYHLSCKLLELEGWKMQPLKARYKSGL